MKLETELSYADAVILGINLFVMPPMFLSDFQTDMFRNSLLRGDEKNIR